MSSCHQWFFGRLRVAGRGWMWMGQSLSDTHPASKISNSRSATSGPWGIVSSSKYEVPSDIRTTSSQSMKQPQSSPVSSSFSAPSVRRMGGREIRAPTVFLGGVESFEVSIKEKIFKKVSFLDSDLVGSFESSDPSMTDFYNKKRNTKADELSKTFGISKTHGKERCARPNVWRSGILLWEWRSARQSLGSQRQSNTRMEKSWNWDWWRWVLSLLLPAMSRWFGFASGNGWKWRFWNAFRAFRALETFGVLAYRTVRVFFNLLLPLLPEHDHR